jgi:murein DD-endopeptidase MepM/ murein hydrolase activator NlpD
MKSFSLSIFTIALVLSACGAPTSAAFIGTSIPVFTETPAQTNTLIATPTPTVPPVTATVSPALDDRPVFLAWPLPAYIGTARISQYPNTPWTWNYLGLNPGYQCPPAYGYLLNTDSLPYWRDLSIPEEQDKAQADPHNFEMVECYSTDSNAGANGHEGTDIKAPAGTPVFTAADGKIQQWRLSGWNTMIVLKHCLGGAWDAHNQCSGGRQWYTTYMHIIPDMLFLKENMDVAQGTQIATVLDQADNSHLHFEVGLDKRSYANFVNPWGRDSTPWFGCMWLDQSVCTSPNPDHKRMAFYTTSERLFVKQGDLNPIEVYGASGIKEIRASQNRLALIDSKNDLLLWDDWFGDEGESISAWTALAENVVDFQMTVDRIAVLDGSRNLWILDNSQWRLQEEHVRAYSVSDHRAGYLTENGDLFVKEGGLDDEWMLVGQNVFAFQLNDNRVAVVDQQGSLFVNEGKLPAEWEFMAGNPKAFQLTNVRLGIIDANNSLLVKEGNLRAEWVTLAQNVQSFQLADNRILMQDLNGTFKLKEGSPYQAWSDLLVEELKFAFLNGGTPVFIP